MAIHLFSRFLTCEIEYARAVNYWKSLWGRVSPEWRQAKGWVEPWLTTQTADGTQLFDGNPIFSAVSEEVDKGIRVIQYEPSSSKVEFDHWLDRAQVTSERPGGIDELVISCSLSDAAADLAFRAMEAWIQDRPITVRNSGRTSRSTYCR